MASTVIYFDEKRPKKNGNCSVKVKITHNRERKYYATGIELTKSEFERVLTGKRKTTEETNTTNEIDAFKAKADKVIKELTIFTFDGFEKGFFTQRNVENSVYFAFDQHIKELEGEKRLGTAESYKYAKKSLELFKKKLTFAEITVSFLNKYESWMLQKNKSTTTIGIYLRSLRAIYNQQNIDSSIYPFGDHKTKYTIPTGRNIKKALTIEEIAKIYNYTTEEKTPKDRAKDYWIFLYLSNGMNVKDFCLLKWSDIDGNTLTYQRAKTKRSTKENRKISVALKLQTMRIIKKWGCPSLVKDAFIFPHLQNNMTDEKQRATYKLLTQSINKYMKQIAKEIKIEKEITTYFARHSFATVLKRAGASIEMISELLGHSSVVVTDSYLSGFEKEQIHKQTDVLTIGL